MQQYFFITGAPRTGTTFLSDWLSEVSDTYCVHEVLRALEGLTDGEIITYLEHCAATGCDRTDKPLQREFLRWEAPKHKMQLRLLGLKEPITWSIEAGAMPYAVDGFLDRVRANRLIAIRHPYDAIASGKRRGQITRNWPNFSVEQHCRFWLDTIALADRYALNNYPMLVIRWEKLMLDYVAVKSSIEEFLDVPLPHFYGNERSLEDLNQLRDHVSLSAGLTAAHNRDLLSAADYRIIAELTGSECNRLGYVL